MKIRQLSVVKISSQQLDISWTLSGGGQSAFELFLIRNGAVAAGARASSHITRCRLDAAIEPLKSYAILLTVTSGRQMASVCAGVYPQRDCELCQTILYQKPPASR